MSSSLLTTVLSKTSCYGRKKLVMGAVDISGRTRRLAGVLIGLALLAQTPTALSDASSLAPKSILDREAPGTGLTHAEINRSKILPQGSEPVLLPLPTPLLAAAIGLAGAFAFRCRRS